jgi:hypothetical protein
MRTIIFLLLLGIGSSIAAQTNWLSKLHEAYPDYREKALEDRRFKHGDLVDALGKLQPPFRVKQEGSSVEERSIHSVRIGDGPVTVLLWSQMHGDEPTATAALMDIFCFLEANDDDDFVAFRKNLLERLTLVFIPMLNPDGAENFERRNALGIDLNRDALRLTSPEAQLLKRVRDEIDADWGFNLHDQSRYYGAGFQKDDMATLSFLAPAYDFPKTINPSRERAMQVIAQLNAGLQQYIPGKVARYSDAFEPRAFGDNMQKWGTSTILIESGGFPDDREKQYIRQLNFASILAACHSIANQSYRSFTRADYNKIPYNNFGVYNDLLLREIKYLHPNGNTYLMDIAFDLGEREYGGKAFYFHGAIDDIGDLTSQQGYTNLAPSNYTAEIGKLFPEVLENLEQVKALDAMSLLKAGYAVVRAQKPGPPWDRHQYPLWILGAEGIYDREVVTGLNPPLIIRNSAGEVVYAVINGQLVKVE